MDIFNNLGESAWAQYHRRIVENIVGGESDGIVVQPAAVAIRAEWDTNNAARNLWFKQDVANSLPAWGPLYRRTGLYLPDSYKALLDKLNSKLISGSGIPDKKKLEKLDEERSDIRALIDKLEDKANELWEKYVRKTPVPLLKTRAKWEEDEGFSGQREDLQHRLEIVEGAYLVIVNDAGGDLAEVGRAVSALGAQNQQIALPFDEEMVELGKDYWQYYYVTSLDGDIFKFKSESAPNSFTLKHGQSETTNFQGRWNAGVSFGWCLFFSASGGVEHEDRSEKFKADTEEITINYENLAAFNIKRGQWYKEGLVRRFADNINQSFFEQDGSLPLIPTQIILAHGLSIDVKVGTESRDYFYNRHTVSGGGGFSLGPFSIGGGGSSTTTYENLKVEKTSSGLHIEDTSGRAVLLAVISQCPFDWLTSPLSHPFYKTLQTEFGERLSSIRNGLFPEIDLTRVS
jgi:hypothetical protein